MAAAFCRAFTPRVFPLVFEERRQVPPSLAKHGSLEDPHRQCRLGGEISHLLIWLNGSRPVVSTDQGRAGDHWRASRPKPRHNASFVWRGQAGTTMEGDNGLCIVFGEHLDRPRHIVTDLVGEDS